MFLFVICFNCSLALCNLLLAIGLYFFYQQLKRLRQRLNQIDNCCQRVLAPAPQRLGQFSQQNRQLRQKYTLLAKKWSMLQEILQIWRFTNNLF